MESTTVPFIYHDNRMLIQCRIDGQGPFWLIVDTGDSAFDITYETAKAVGLATHPAGTVSGAGSGTPQVSAAKVKSLSIGTLVLHNMDAEVMDLSQIRAKFHFPHLDGAIGYPLMQRYVTYVNVDDGTITFAGSAPVEPSTASTTKFDGVLPIVAGRIDGIPTTILVDTGDRSSLTLFTPFAKRHAFYGKYPSQSNIVTGYGVGGPIYADVFTLPSLDVFDTPLRDIVARAARPNSGVFSTQSLGGSIGTGVLKRFNVVYDYGHKTIAVWPSKYFTIADRFVPPGS
ncbi:MAG: aspartyl protease family protein [Candidatus Eremiobacteraeota bacterium]|nr:aspartyl protease family protein [Candidatus Eremiobacteraeota bacterium]MBV8721790.1 aspartyl protease family protein [Candidatus Eremiobacteraeota bacterium]